MADLMDPTVKSSKWKRALTTVTDIPSSDTSINLFFPSLLYLFQADLLQEDMNNEEKNFLNVNWKFLYLHIIVVRDLLDNLLYDL